MMTCAWWGEVVRFIDIGLDYWSEDFLVGYCMMVTRCVIEAGIYVRCFENDWGNGCEEE